MPRVTAETRPVNSLNIDWRDPDYNAIYQTRIDNLKAIREDIRNGGHLFPDLCAAYAEVPWNFISDWGMTYDPRNADIGRPTYVPFILFPKQIEWCKWVISRWRGREPGLCEKSRDMGVSWLAMALGATLCIFNRGIAIGVGSRKTEYVDKIGTFKPLLPKARIFLENIPTEFIPSWDANQHAPFMRIAFPDTGSIIAGEGGDDIGRGDRTSIYFVDEYAHFERADLTEASLSQTTNCRIDMSSVRGMNNAFARKRWEGKVDVFIFDWHDDPRKDQAWYEKQKADLDPVVVAQEIDRDYQASVSGVVIPAAWAKACIGAKRALGIAPSGIKAVTLDIADEGVDKNAAGRFHGTSVMDMEEWSGVGGDIYQTVERAFEICDEHGADFFEYDADGLGAGARGDARVINERRAAAHLPIIRAIGHRGSEAVHDPDGIVEGTIGREGDRGRTNQDYFLNRKSQGWWEVRRRARNTYRWRVEGIKCAPDDLLDIDPNCRNAMKIAAELSQATYSINVLGKMLINKTPPGMKSPNLADTVVIRYAPKEPPPMRITQELVSQLARAGQMARRRRY
jgi:phage terminase large subunit